MLSVASYAMVSEQLKVDAVQITSGLDMGLRRGTGS
jgi:hypothetical protein